MFNIALSNINNYKLFLNMPTSQKQFSVFKGIYEFEDPSGTLIAARIPHSGTADLYKGTAVVVRANQCALFLYKGKIADVLPGGTHTVQTENLPVLTRLANWRFGLRSPLRCEIWFFSNTVYTARRWGTAQPVIHDFPDYRAVPIRAFGNFNIVPRDPKKIYMTLIGNRTSYDVTELESFVQAQITELLPQALSVVPSLETLNKSQDDVSKELQILVNNVLRQYGLQLIDLQVMSLVPSQEVIKALNAKAAMNIIGNKQEYLLYKAADSLVGQQGQVGGGDSRANDPMQLMLGLMLGKNLLNADFREKEQLAMSRMSGPKEAYQGAQFCSKCGSTAKSADKFCSSCGAKLKK